jgi:hypothetical protein
VAQMVGRLQLGWLGISWRFANLPAHGHLVVSQSLGRLRAGWRQRGLAQVVGWLQLGWLGVTGWLSVFARLACRMGCRPT